MATRRSIKKAHPQSRSVGVIATLTELRLASRRPRPPDLFEIRLDHFHHINARFERMLSILPAPLIITARHPREGGASHLPVKRRRELFVRFLPYARYVDVELRSAETLRSVLTLPRRRNIRRIISFHDFESTPSVRTLSRKARAAELIGADIFKVATRTDRPDQVARLVEFLSNTDVDLALSVMGMGKLGRESRRELLRCGSALVYGHLGRARLAGQPSIDEIRRWARTMPPPWRTLSVERSPFSAS